MDIRKAEQKDVEQLANMFDKLQKEHIEKYTNKDMWDTIDNASEMWKKYVANDIIPSNDKAIFVAEQDNKLVGYLEIEIKSRPPIFSINKQVYISDVYVDKEHRGQKIGQKLMEKAFEWAKEKDVKVITLEVDEENDAIKFYEKNGFRTFTKEMIKKV